MGVGFDLPNDGSECSSVHLLGNDIGHRQASHSDTVQHNDLLGYTTVGSIVNEQPRVSAIVHCIVFQVAKGICSECRVSCCLGSRERTSSNGSAFYIVGRSG